MSKTIGFRLDVDGTAGSVTKLVQVEQSLGKVTQKLKELKKEGNLDKNIDQFEKLRAEQLKLQQEGTKLRKEIREQNKAFETAQYPKDSLVGLRMEYNNLSKQISILDAQTLKSTHGQNLVNQAAAIDAQIKKTEYSIGNFRRNVGNYQDAMRGVGSLVGGQLGIAGVGMGTGTGIMSMINPWMIAAGGAIKVISDLSKVSKEYESSLSNLEAISNATADDLEKLEDQAMHLGATTAFTSTEVLQLQTELAKLGFTVDEILSSAGGINKLSTALKVDAGRAAALAGAALRSFRLDAEEMDRVVSVLAVSTTKSALDFSKLETAIPIVSSVAKTFNFSIEDTVALLGELANAGFDASMAATATRNILLNLANANGALAQRLGGSVSNFEELIDGLVKLRSEGIELNETLELTDKRSVAAFNNFLSGAEKASELRDSLSNLTTELDDIANKQLDNAAGKALLMKSAYEGLLLSIDSGDGTLSKARKNWSEFWTDQFTALRLYNEGYLNIFRSAPIGFLGLKKSIAEAQDQMEADKFTDKNNPFAQLPIIAELAQQKIGDLGDGTEEAIDKKIINPLVKLQNEIKKLKEDLQDEDLTGNQIDSILKKIASAEAKMSEITGRGGKRFKSNAKELVEGSLEYLENQVRVAEAALKSTNIADTSIIDKIKGDIDKAKVELENARKSLRSAEEIALEMDLEGIEKSKNAEIIAAIESGVEREAIIEKLQKLEDDYAVKTLETQIAYAKEGSKEREALEVQLARKRFEINNKAAASEQTGLKKKIQSELDEVSKILATDLTALTEKYKAEFATLDGALNNAIGIEQYEAILEEKKAAEKQFNDDIKALTLEAEEAKLRIKLQYSEKGSLEEAELLKRLSEIDLDLTRLTEEAKDRIRQENFEKEKDRQEELKQSLEDFYLDGLDFAQDAAQTITDIRQDQIEHEKNAMLDALTKETEAKIEAAEGNTQLIERIREEDDAKREQIEREAFERTKRLAKAEAKIQAGIAAIRAFVTPGWPQALLLLPFIAGQLALSLADINAQQFALGGKVQRIDPNHFDKKIKKLSPGRITESPNYPTTPGGDNVLALVRPGEVILNETQQSRIGGAVALAAAGVPGFTNGGLVNTLHRTKFAREFNTGGRVRPLNFNPNEVPYGMIDISNPPGASLGLSDDQMVKLANTLADVLSARLGDAVHSASREGTRQGAFEGLNDDKRLKDRENSSRQNSTF